MKTLRPYCMLALGLCNFAHAQQHPVRKNAVPRQSDTTMVERATDQQNLLKSDAVKTQDHPKVTPQRTDTIRPKRNR